MSVPSYYPEGGWSQESFQSPDGLRMLRDYIRIQTKWKQRGVKKFSAALNRRFNQLFRNLIEEVQRRDDLMLLIRSASSGKASVRVTLDPIGDQNLWADAISSVLTEFNVDFSIDARPIYDETMTGIMKETTTILNGRDAFKTELARLKPKARDLATQVTGISATTKDRLGKEIQRAIDDGLTMPEAIKRLRKRFPQIAKNRIPTIARTEMGRAADFAATQTMIQDGGVSHVSVVNCQAIEPNIPMYRGVPTCNIQMVPIGDVTLLQFHPNHTGSIVPAKFIQEEARPVVDPINPKPPKPPVRIPVPPRKPTSAVAGTIEEVVDQPQISPEQKVWNDIQTIEKKLLADEAKIAKLKVSRDKLIQDFQAERRKRFDLEMNLAKLESGELDFDPVAISHAAGELGEVQVKMKAIRAKLNKANDAISKGGSGANHLKIGAEKGDADSMKFNFSTGDTKITNHLRKPAAAALKWLDEVSGKGVIQGQSKMRKIKVVLPENDKGVPTFNSRSHAKVHDSNYSTGEGIIAMGTAKEKTLVHEIWHLVEDFDQPTLDRSYQFLYRRAKNKNGVKKKLTHMGRGYNPEEVTFSGTKFESIGPIGKYAAKPYIRSVFAKPNYGKGTLIPNPEDLIQGDLYATEVGTMGIERLRENPLKFLKDDPEWFRFCMGTLRGVYLDDDIIKALK